MRINHTFEDYLLINEVITENQLWEAIDYKKIKKINLQQALIELGFATELAILETLSKQLNIPLKNSAEVLVNPDAFKKIPEDLLTEYNFFPFDIQDKKLLILTKEPLNLKLEDEMKKNYDYTLEYYLCTGIEISKMIDKYFMQSNLLGEIEGLDLKESDDEYFDITINDENSPVVKTVNAIFRSAVQEGASDIHIGPTDKKVEVRYRIDGILQLAKELPKALHPALVSRIKTMADMNIAEKRTAQDGRIQSNLDGKSIDMRVSTLPSVTGEKVTIRILDKGNLLMSLQDLGFSDVNYEKFSKLLATPFGIILITGPTGSGKSSSLYTAINELNDVSKNIITIEDPVEYRLDSIVQVQVNPKAGLTFAEGLRSILRQDPDIILIGEIRDDETAQIAVKASNTGHLVLSTLHTNDAVSSILRLVDMGVAPYLVAGTIQGVSNQRLVRKICNDCKISYTSQEISPDRAFFGINDDRPITLYKGEGCLKCKGTGYKGRLPIHELLIMNDELRRMIIMGASEQDIRDRAIEQGMATLKADGLEKALSGYTTLEEVRRFVAE